MLRFSEKTGIRNFLVVWSGQLFSIIGTALTAFVLGLWVYKDTGSVTLFTLISLFAILPGIIISPFAGIIVDRIHRKTVLIFSDAIGGLSIAAIAILLAYGRLEIWHIYVMMGLSSICNTFQISAYSASITLLVPKDYYGRANGMVQLCDGMGRLVSPILAGILMVHFETWQIIAIDVVTYFIAVITTIITEIPQPKEKHDKREKSNIFSELSFGWKYIKARPGLLAILAFFSITNYFIMTTTILSTPMILAFESSTVLGAATSIAGCGMLIGSIGVSIWKGPKKRVECMLYCYIGIGTCLVLSGIKESITIITIAIFIVLLLAPIQQGCSNAIWQSKVEPDLQGRVFSTRRMVAQSTIPLAYALSGPLSERVFRPLLNTDFVGGSIGQVIGTGESREIALMFIVMGICTVVLAVSSFFYPRIRNIEEELPDMTM